MAAQVLGVLLAFLGAATAAIAGDYSPRSHFYAVEYLKPSPGTENLSFINIVFNRQLDPQSAERALREEIQRAISLFPPQGNIMAYAWTETDPAPGSEEAIALPDGSDFLIYIGRTKQIKTGKQYFASQTSSADPSKRPSVDD